MKKLLSLFLFIVIVAVFAILLLKSKPAGPKAPDVLYGVNLGGWLADELRFGKDRFECDLPSVHEQLQANFGMKKADELLEIYRDAFISEKDFAQIKAMGFNAVRLPVGAAYLFEQPGDKSRADRMIERIAWVFDQAQTNGLAVILNIRVRAGEWAPQPPVKGRRFQARWSDRDVTAVAAVWTKLAGRFKGNPVLFGYDLSPGSCRVDADMQLAYEAWSNAIRKEDASRMIFAPWPRPALEEFVNHEQGIVSNAGYAVEMIEEAFASEDSAAEIRMSLENDLHSMNSYWSDKGMACLVTEYNPALLNESGLEWLGAYRSEFKRLGWNSMLWTFKSLIFGQDSDPHASLVRVVFKWQMPDFATTSHKKAEDFFKAIDNVVYNADLKLGLGLEEPVLSSYKAKEGASVQGQEREKLSGAWVVEAQGGVDCEVMNITDNTFTIISSGLGTEGYDDEFGFVYQSVQGGFNLNTVVVETDFSSSTAGAGLMVRSSLDDSSPYLLLYKAAEGEIVSIVDNANGQPVVRRTLSKKSGNDHLRVMTDGIVLKASCSSDGSTWPIAANFTAPWITNQVLVGAAVFSGHEYRTAKAVFGNITFNQDGIE